MLYSNITEISEMIKKMLHNGAVEVDFVKADGTDRKMYCTLSVKILTENNALPKGVLNKDGSKRKVSTECIRAFDLEKKAWRSFRVDSVKSCCGISEEQMKAVSL